LVEEKQVSLCKASLLHLADNHNMDNHFDDILKRYEAARKTGSSIYLEPDDLTDIAEYYHLHGKLDEALEAIDIAINMFPGATQPLAFRARVAILVNKDAQEAMQWADQIADKTDLDYYYIVAEIMIADQRIDEAVQYLKDKETEIDEDDLEDFYLDVGTLFADYSYSDIVEEWLAKSHETQDSQYRELLGRVALAKGDFDVCLRIFNQLIDEDPYNTDYWNTLASAQFLQGNMAATIESCDYALAIDTTNADALINKANALSSLGNCEEAIKCYQSFHRLQPYNETADMCIASVLTTQNRFQEALFHLRQAERLAPKDSPSKIEIIRQQCILNAQLGKHAEALADIRKMDGIPGHNTAENNVLRGYLYLLNNQPVNANAWFTRAMEISGNDIRIKTLVAYSTYECGYTQFAHDLFREIMDNNLGKDSPEGWAFLALCDVDLGLRQEFLSDLHQAVLQGPAKSRPLLVDIFPEGLPFENYEKYAKEHPELGTWPNKKR